MAARKKKKATKPFDKLRASKATGRTRAAPRRTSRDRLPTRRMEDLTWQRFGELVPRRIDRVLVPVGTMEAHGVLPLGTDTLIPARLAERLAPDLDALVAPAMPYGLTSSLLAYPGSMTLERRTFVDAAINNFERTYLST